MNTKKVLALAATLLAGFSIFAKEAVNEDEIRSVGDFNSVVFENYVGPHSVINTIDEIRAIGATLGEVVAQDPEKAQTVGYAPKYSVIHAVDPNESGKLEADILVLGPSSLVDHINNVRRIISAYLTAAYGYSRGDADTVATFVTVYNAVYRGNINYFQSKYKKVVTDNLTADKAGIALKYSEWPGNTQLVIPLSDLNGGLSTVETSVISDKQVVKSMQEDEDKNIDSRKAMVDIKEREADNAAEKAAAAQKAAEEEAARLKAQQEKEAQAKKEAEEKAKQAEEARKAAEEAAKAAEEAKAKAEQDKKDAEAKKAAEEAAKAAEEAAKTAEEATASAEQAQQTAETESAAAEEQAQKTAEATEAAAAEQAKADQKRAEAQEERTTIAADQQEVQETQEKNESAPNVYGLKAVDELGIMSSLVRMNANDGTVIKESPVTVIRSRTLYETAEGFVGIAGTNIGNGTVKLVLIDKENMEITKESAETVAETSVLAEDNGNFYCVIQENGKNIIGKYNSSLENLLKSPVAVKAATPITVTESGMLVTNANGRPVLLNMSDLTQITASSSSTADAK